jgi:predicted peptidase
MCQEAPCRLEIQATETVPLSYLLFLPKGYGHDPDRKWPLILFLHGRGERGDDLELIKIHGIPKITEQQDDFGFIAVSPQCPADTYWVFQTTELKMLLDEVVSAYEVDTNRLYLTGLSMGGFGTWYLAMDYPEQFAAIAPICGGGVPTRACVLKDLPIWAFHGAKDDVVPIEESENMVNALEACGGNVKFTIYPDGEHDVYTQTYDNPELYAWFLEHSKK